jgi:hypothetical protein
VGVGVMPNITPFYFIKFTFFFPNEKSVTFIKRNKNYILNNACRNHAFSLKKLSTQEEERCNKNDPLKAAPVQLKSTGKIATKLSQESCRGRPKEILDGPGQSGKKTPQDPEPEGQNKESCNHEREEARNCTP